MNPIFRAQLLCSNEKMPIFVRFKKNGPVAEWLRQSSAKASTAVRIRSGPLKKGLPKGNPFLFLSILTLTPDSQHFVNVFFFFKISFKFCISFHKNIFIILSKAIM